MATWTPRGESFSRGVVIIDYLVGFVSRNEGPFLASSRQTHPARLIFSIGYGADIVARQASIE